MKAIQSKLCEIVDFLSKHDCFLNSHATNFFTKNLWSNVLPTNLLQDLENMSPLADFPVAYLDHVAGRQDWDCEKFPEVGNFLKTADRLSLKNSTLITPITEIENFLSITDNNERLSKTFINDFMTVKKTHEVVEMVKLVEKIIEKTSTNTIIDVGSGKGYMSSTLSYISGVNVLSLDSSAITACGAKKLDTNMGKKLKLRNRGKHVRETLHVSPCITLEPLLISHFGVPTQQSGLLGLHTCGQLAATSCQLYVNQNMRWFVNVGCCYHLMQEQFGHSDFWDDFNIVGSNEALFPLSSFLKSKRAVLGRNARMIAAHCVEKLAHDGINEVRISLRCNVKLG